MTYSVKSDTETIFGVENIQQWADLDNDDVSADITSRITWAIQEAYDQINSRLFNCRYDVPFTQVSGAYDPVIVTLSARLTGVLLYDNRKLIDVEEFDQVQNHRKMVEQTYADIHAGRIKLLVYDVQAVNYPQAIAAESS